MKSMDFEVQVLESSFVAPSELTPSQGLWLSSLDLMHANRGHTSTIYLYSSSDVSAAADFFDVARLKEALAKALVAFYPLAGRLGINGDDGRMEISCNNGEGALFVVARADGLTVDDVKKFQPSPEQRRMFVPRVDPSSIMLAIQVIFRGAYWLRFWSQLQRDQQGKDTLVFLSKKIEMIALEISNRGWKHIYCLQ